MKLYRSHVMASVAGVTTQTLAAWVKNGTLVPHATNEAGDPLWTAEQLREQHAAVRAASHAAIERSTAALIEAGALEEYEQQCDALRESSPL